MTGAQGFAASLVLHTQESAKSDQGMAQGWAPTLKEKSDPLLRPGHKQYVLIEALASLPLEFNNVDVLGVEIMQI